TFPPRKPYVEAEAAAAKPDTGDTSEDAFADLDSELDSALESPPTQKKASLLSQYVPAEVADRLIGQLTATTDPETPEEPTCENSPNEVAKSSSEPSPIPSQTQTQPERSRSTPPTKEPSSKTPIPSLEALPSQGILPSPANPM